MLLVAAYNRRDETVPLSRASEDSGVFRRIMVCAAEGVGWELVTAGEGAAAAAAFSVELAEPSLESDDEVLGTNAIGSASACREALALDPGGDANGDSRNAESDMGRHVG